MNFIKHLDHLNLNVLSLAQTIAWYRDVFGFTVVEGGIRKGVPWAILRAGDAMLCVYEMPAPVTNFERHPLRLTSFAGPARDPSSLSNLDVAVPRRRFSASPDHPLTSARFRSTWPGDALGLDHFAFRITDRAAWEATLTEHKLPLLYGGVTEWAHSTAWYVTDPNGFEIEVALWHDDVVSFAGKAIDPPANGICV